MVLAGCFYARNLVLLVACGAAGQQRVARPSASRPDLPLSASWWLQAWEENAKGRIDDITAVVLFLDQ